MQLPIKRVQLSQRTERDEDDEVKAFARETPERRVARAIALIERTRKLGKAAKAGWVSAPGHNLAKKALRYVAPLRTVKSAG